MMSVKRRRSDEEEACEALGGLLRQAASRAVERVRLLRQQRSGLAGSGAGLSILTSSAAENVVRAAKPMDVLVIRFCVCYLDCSRVAGSTHFVQLAQGLVTSSVERVLVPQLFTKGSGSLPALCEALVAEHTAEDIQAALKEINEFVEARGALGTWLAEAAANVGPEDEDGYAYDSYGGEWDQAREDRHDEHGRLKGEEEGIEDGPEDDRSGGFAATDVDVDEGLAKLRGVEGELTLASTLYAACEFWVRVQAFLNAVSLHSARLHSFTMPPRYEKELLLLLYSATRGSSDVGVSTVGLPRSQVVASSLPPLRGAMEPTASGVAAKEEGVGAVKREPKWDEEGAGTPTAEMRDGYDGADDDEAQPSSPARQPQQLYKASALLADVLALSRCPAAAAAPLAATPTAAPRLTASSPTPAPLKGINPEFYKMVYARLGVMVARERLHRFDQVATVAPPQLTMQQRNLQTQLLQQQEQQQEASAGAAGVSGAMEAGLPTNYVPDDAYFDKLLHQQHDTVEEDEEVYKGEVMDYYLTHPGRHAAAATSAAAASRGRSHGGPRVPGKDGDGETPLMKPHRFCKVKTGFTWTQYNRTHYDSRTNPPPRTEMWYEFTLFYPALANTKRDMRHIFRIEDAPEGPNDQYCLLVFSVGPPYADVAYRIRKKQWDTRRGGVRISFDQTGRYKLFFRFTNSNYRR